MTEPEQEYEIYVGPVPSKRREDTMKCWMIELSDDTVIQPGLFYFQKNFPGAKATEYPSNPLEPIIEVWEKYKDRGDIQQIIMVSPIAMATDLWQAVQRCRAIVEGKP